MKLTLKSVPREDIVSRAFYFPAERVIKVSVLGQGPSDFGLQSKDRMTAFSFDKEGNLRGLEILDYNLVSLMQASEPSGNAPIRGNLKVGDFAGWFENPVSCQLCLDPLVCEVTFTQEEEAELVVIGDALTTSLSAAGRPVKFTIQRFSDPSEFARIHLPPGMRKKRDSGEL